MINNIDNNTWTRFYKNKLMKEIYFPSTFLCVIKIKLHSTFFIDNNYFFLSIRSLGAELYQAHSRSNVALSCGCSLRRK